MIDLHAHVLPGLDDGPRTVTDAIALAQAAIAAGTGAIVATPHINHRYNLTPPQVAGAVEQFSAVLRQEGIELTLLGGGEISIERLVDLSDGELDRLGLGGGRCLLVEPPLRDMPGPFEWPIRSLLDAGRRVLIAHPERCPGFVREPERLRALIDGGAFSQITVGSLLGKHGEPARQFACDLVSDGLAHNLASDMHDEQRRAPSLSAGLAALTELGLITTAHGRWLTVETPQAIIDGSELPPHP
jgi:protein-tyrosine phosphatase